MASSQYSPAKPEYLASGNSGDPSTSQKLNNSNTVQVRNAHPAASVKTASKITVNQIQASNSSTGQPPTTAASGASSATTSFGNPSVDTYRNKDWAKVT